MAKRITKGNIGENFTVEVEGSGYRQSVRLLDVIGTGDGAQIFFSDPYYPGGEWGKWRCDRFGGKIWYNGKKVTVIQ